MYEKSTSEFTGKHSFVNDETSLFISAEKLLYRESSLKDDDLVRFFEPIGRLGQISLLFESILKNNQHMFRFYLLRLKHPIDYNFQNDAELYNPYRILEMNSSHYWIHIPTHHRCTSIKVVRFARQFIATNGTYDMDKIMACVFSLAL